MGRGLVVVGTALTVLLLVGLACDDGSGVGTVYYRTPSAIELQTEAQMAAARETAVAQATRDALEGQSRATADALALQAQATTQVLNAEATAQAQAIEATRSTWAIQSTIEAARVQATTTVEAYRATATREALDGMATATRQAVSGLATVTAQQLAGQVEATRSAGEAVAIRATTEAIQRQEARERITQPVQTWGPWVIAVVACLAILWAGWRLAKVLEARARMIRRRADEGEPVVVLDGDRLALPLRTFGPYVDITPGQERAPLLAPSEEWQNAATMRQQTANALQARQAAAIVRGRNTKAPRVVAMARDLPAPVPRPSPTRQPVPGLVRVVVSDLSQAAAQGVLPPRLADAIEGQWVQEEEGEEGRQ